MVEIQRSEMNACDFADFLKEELIGHRIVSVDELSLTTDNGYRITLDKNYGCGGCSSGWSDIDLPADLADCENAIVDVSIEQGSGEESTISIFKENKKLSLISADDGYGNGYYGGGFYVTVSRIEKGETQ